MIGVVMLALYRTPPAIGSIAAALSFALLIAGARHAWTPGGTFGLANGITALRLAATLTLLLISGTWVIKLPLALAILALDGLDGWVARKCSLNSPFGEYFDKEVDAFFTLTLCLILFRDQHLQSWIMLPGVLRYLFVLYLKAARPPRNKETATRFGKFIGVLVLVTLMLCLLPLPRICSPLAQAATLALALSFAVSLKQIHARP